MIDLHNITQKNQKQELDKMNKQIKLLKTKQNEDKQIIQNKLNNFEQRTSREIINIQNNLSKDTLETTITIERITTKHQYKDKVLTEHLQIQQFLHNSLQQQEMILIDEQYIQHQIIELTRNINQI